MRTLWQRIGLVPSHRPGKWIVVAAWLAATATATPVAGTIGQIMANDERSWLPRSAQSTRAVDIQKTEFPAADPADLLVVYERASGLTSGDLATAQADRSRLTAYADTPIGPVTRSSDGRALLITVPIASSTLETGEVESIVDAARDVLAGSARDGLTVLTTGPAASRADTTRASGTVETGLLIVTLALVALILAATYRSPILVVVPLVCVALASVTAQALVATLARYAGLNVNGSSLVLLEVLILGVGTDYALLMISRYRREQAIEPDRPAAMARTTVNTVPTVLGAAATVIAASLALLLARMNSTRSLAPIVLIGVLCAMAVMTTLLPAVLLLFGRLAFWPRKASARSSGGWQRLAESLDRNPRKVWTTSALALGALSFGALLLTIAAPQGAQAFTRTPEFVAGQQILARHFPSGSVSPAQIFAPTAYADRIRPAVTGVPGVAEVTDSEVSPNGSWTRITVVLADDPGSTAARRTIRQLRAMTAEITPDAVVGGRTAATLDQNEAMIADLRTVVPLTILGIAIVLALLLRTPVAAAVLVGCVLSSAGAGLGIAGLVLAAIGHPVVDPAALLLGFIFLVALGADYAIFLMSRARQEAESAGHRQGVRQALVGTGGVITSAGLVLAATFSVLIATPVVLNLQIGILVAAGVLVDTFVVRTLLVPALALDLGPRTWWPRRVQV
ncbi:MAG: MMPL family transporter [Hamadaea sp.]|uniref:MMPL family transporter n=1 Tax=Hamadaea sp. TaxID=2024425 RepID=UPI0017B37CF8|nr:MMPL family transporter [Hamadaea sp.]NUT18761.1 MMPL family transporter [Hamadaea sp.]